MKMLAQVVEIVCHDEQQVVRNLCALTCCLSVCLSVILLEGGSVILLEGGSVLILQLPLLILLHKLVDAARDLCVLSHQVQVDASIGQVTEGHVVQ